MIANCFTHITPLCDHTNDTTPASIVREFRASSIDKKSIPAAFETLLQRLGDLLASRGAVSVGEKSVSRKSAAALSWKSCALAEAPRKALSDDGLASHSASQDTKMVDRNSNVLKIAYLSKVKRKEANPSQKSCRKQPTPSTRYAVWTRLSDTKS
jgi:hypothetical protein